MWPKWGISLEGNHIRGIVIQDVNSPKILCEMSIPIEQEKGYYHILGQVHNLVEVLSSEVGVKPTEIGVASPGNIDPITKTLKGSYIHELNSKPLRTDLETYLGFNVKLSNLGKCFSLAETRFGTVVEVLPNAKCVFGILLNENVEAGVIFNGRIYKGRQAIAGSFAHNFLNESGGDCTCGKVGCVNTFISSRALELFYFDLCGKRRYFDEIAQRANDQNDIAAAKTIDHLVYHFAQSISPIINILDPDCIVVGGQAGMVEALHKKSTQILKRFVHNSRIDTLIFKPKLESLSTVHGAALL